MKLQIDNFDGAGPRDYSSAIESTGLPRVIRRLNQPSELRFSLLSENTDFIVPASGGRVTLGRTNGQDVFTGYITEPPAFEYLGWGQTGPAYLYKVLAHSDEFALDRKRIPSHPPFVARSAGDALRQLSEDLLPGVLDTSAAQDLDVVPYYAPDPTKRWSEHAAKIALSARASYRTSDGALVFAPVGSNAYTIDETANNFSPEGLKLNPQNGLVNDITVSGLSEPQAFVKDYFVGDGFSLKFYLSQTPFTRRNRTIVEEEYKGTVLGPTRWTVTDPSNTISVSGGKLQVAGGTGVDGATTVRFAEKVELGGAFVLQHGDVTFSSPSDGVIGGLYVSVISLSACLAGFRISPSGTGSAIQGIINGSLTGPTLITTPSHHYVFSTRFYATEIYRSQQVFHSSLHPAGSARGGSGVTANIRVVLEVHEIDPANPGSLVTPSSVLYDGIINSAPGFCIYALANSASLHCAIAFTRMTQAIDAEVRSALPGQSYRTRLAGSQSDGAECLINSDPALQFFPQNVPAANELIEVKYRGRGQAMARITNPSSIAALAHGDDDGLRAVVRHVKTPPARTAADCESAALALLDDAGTAWSGEYKLWSDFLPGSAPDIFPGDSLNINAPTQNAAFTAIAREIELEVKDFDQEHSLYTIRFANDAAASASFEFDTSQSRSALDVAAVRIDQVGTTFLASLTAATLSGYSSTTFTLDAGSTPPAGGGVEVRRSDFGWGPDNDRNLVGRFTAQTFTVPRLSRVQDYFLRQFDASTPPRYSRYSAALHIDYPL